MNIAKYEEDTEELSNLPNEARQSLGVRANAPSHSQRVTIFSGDRRLKLGLPRNTPGSWC